MTLEWAPWSAVASTLPVDGRQVVAAWDDDTVVVFQAYGRRIGEHALAHGAFGGKRWRFDRSSKVRASFLALMHRTDWGREKGRTVVLAIHVRREEFDALLRQAVHSEFPESLYSSKRSWQLATRYTQVMMAWFPDRDPQGEPLRRASLGLEVRDGALRRFAGAVSRIVSLEEQVAAARGRGRDQDTLVPVVRPYPISGDALAKRLSWQPS